MRKAVTARTQPTSDVDATQMKGHMTNLWIRCRYQRGSWCLHSTCPPRDKHDPPARCSFCMMPAGWCLCRCRPHRGRRTGRYLWRTGRSQARMGCTPHQLPPARSPLHTGCTRLARPPCTPVSNPLLCTCPSPVRTHRSEGWCRRACRPLLPQRCTSAPGWWGTFGSWWPVSPERGMYLLSVRPTT